MEVVYGDKGMKTELEMLKRACAIAVKWMGKVRDETIDGEDINVMYAEDYQLMIDYAVYCNNKENENKQQES